MIKKDAKQNRGSLKFLPLIVFGSVFLLTLLIMTLLFRRLYPGVITNHPVFFDFIIEDTAINGFNKAGEITLFRILTLTGLSVISLTAFLFSVIYHKRLPQTDKPDAASERTDEAAATSANKKMSVELLSPDKTSPGPELFESPIYPLLWLIPALIYYLVGGIVSAPLLFMTLYSFLIAILFRSRHKKESPALSVPVSVFSLLPILSYYSLLGLCTMLSVLSQHFLNPDGSTTFLFDVTSLSQNALYVLTLLMTALLFALLSVSKLPQRIKKGSLLIIQLPIPLLITVFFHDRYLYQGQILHIPYAPLYYVLIALILLAACAFLFFSKKRAFISSVSPVLIFLYQAYQACPMFAQPDQHHHGEQLIPWQQIVTLGQGAYRQYTPVSGLFPMVNGFIQNVLLGKTVSDYAPALALTSLLFAAAAMALLVRHTGPDKALIFAVLFALPCYNRQYMVLPLLLLFFLPALQKRPLAWLGSWLLGCFLAGLYYPLFGGAVLVATLPLCIRQLAGLKKAKKTKIEVLFFILICLPILCAVPLLFRMARHTLTYSSQTVLADGISLAGQSAPETFLSALSLSVETKDAIYLIYRFFLPAVWIWIPGFLASYSLGKRFATGLSKDAAHLSENRESSLSYVAALLTLAVSYSYTLIRADRDVILARTAPVLIAVGMFLAAMILSERKPLKPLSVAVAGLCLALPFFCYVHVNDMKTPYLWTYPNGNDRLVAEDVSKLFLYYEVPSGFELLSQAPVSDHAPLGSGFMASDQFSYLETYDAVNTKLKEQNPDADLSYMGYDGQGFYYYLNTKSCATGFLPVARSYDAQLEILEVAQTMRPVVFPLDPQKSYYIYRWLLSEEADYCYSSEYQCFYPSELTLSSDGNTSLSDYLLSDDAYAKEVSLGRICSHFGDSADTLLGGDIAAPGMTLSQIAEQKNTAICGGDNEYLYISFSDDFLNTLGLEDPSAALLTVSSPGSYAFSDKASALSDNTILRCEIGNGDLILPLGMSPRWYLAKEINLSDVKISISAPGPEQDPESSIVLCEYTLTDLAKILTDQAQLSEDSHPKATAGFYHCVK